MNLLSDQQLVRKMRRCGIHYSKNMFVGVFARDLLPTKLDYYPCTLIINTDTKNLPGKHWVAIYINGYKEGEYFDSFGHAPSEDIALWLNRFTLKWRRVNTSTLQNPLSVNCGQFVLYFIHERPLVNSSQSIMRQFGANTIHNNEIVNSYFDKHFKKC